MTRRLKGLLLASLTLLSFAAAAPASAQDISLGYQWQRLSGEGDSSNMPLGFNIDVARNVSGPLDVVGQFDWSRRREEELIFGTSVEATMNLATFGGGVRWRPATASGSAAPFVQALLGASRMSASCTVAGVDCSEVSEDLSLDAETKLMVQFGGGATFPLRGRTSGLAQIDYRRIFADSGVNSVRFVVGARMRLGK